MADPIVLVSSYPPRWDEVAAFTVEVREFIQKHNPDREVLVISHTDARGEGVFPIINTADPRWFKPVVETIRELNPHVVHVQYDDGLYEHADARDPGHDRDGFLDLLAAVDTFPIVVEPHTIHGRMREAEADFVYRMCRQADVVLFKCQYHKWRLDWTFPGMGWTTPTNILVIPHGARPDRRYGVHEVPELRRLLGLDKSAALGEHLVGLIGWTRTNKRWDILTGMWEELAAEIRNRTGQSWDLLVAAIEQPADATQAIDPDEDDVRRLQRQGLAHYCEFSPTGDDYYRMMGVCDFIVLPGTDEMQSATLARIIALNKPFITAAPGDGMAAQTLESGGGLLFANRPMLKEAVIRLACDEQLRLRLGNQLKSYLDGIASWDLIAGQYNQAYDLARNAKLCGVAVDLPREF